MDIQETLAAWQEVAKYRAARKTLQSGAWGSLIFGLLAVAAALPGFRPDINHVGLLALGTYLLAGFVAAFAAPGFVALVIEGTGLIFVGLWNLYLGLASLGHSGERPGTFWAVLGGLQIFWGIKMLAPGSKFMAIRMSAPSAEAVRRIDDLVKNIKKAREADGVDFVELMCSGSAPMYLRGRLTPEMAFFVDTGGTHVYFALPGDLALTLKKEGPLQKKNKCEFHIRDEKWNCVVPQLSYERIAAWQGPGAGQDPVAPEAPETPHQASA